MLIYLLFFVAGAVVGILAFVFVVNYLNWRDWNRPMKVPKK
jgi:hypothetical protein